MIDTSGLPLWAKELITIGTIIFFSLVTAVAVLWILDKIKVRLASKTSTQLDDKIIDAIKRPLFWLILIYGFSVLMGHLNGQFPDQVGWLYKYLKDATWLVAAIFITIIALRLINIVGVWVTKSIAERADSDVYAEFLPFINRILRLLVFVISGITVLSHFNIDVKGLLTVLGVGSLAVALAAKDTIANMISGFIIMIDRPFRVGDRVILDSGEKCDVFYIGLRSTRFITFENTLIILPNEQLLTSKVTNITYPNSQIRVKVEVGVAYGSNIDEVKKLLLECAKEHPKVLDNPVPKAHLVGLGDSSVDFALMGRVNAITDQWTTQNELRQAIYDKLNEAGIEIPFPQMTVWMKQESA